MLDFTIENLSADEVERLRRIYEPLTQSVRELIDATIRTEVDAEVVAAVKAEIDSAPRVCAASSSTGHSASGWIRTGRGWPGATSWSVCATRRPRRWWSTMNRPV